MKELSTLTKITFLNLSGNKITEVKGLSTLTILTNLNLNFNKITEVGELSSLANLTNLVLSYNPLCNIRYLPTPNKTLSIYINEDQKSLLEQGFLSLHSKHHFSVHGRNIRIEPLLARKRKWVTMLAIVIKNPNYANYNILSETLDLTDPTAKNMLLLSTKN